MSSFHWDDGAINRLLKQADHKGRLVAREMLERVMRERGCTEQEAAEFLARQVPPPGNAP